MDFIKAINDGTRTQLELGCGSRRARHGYVTVDNRAMDSVDIVGDARDVLQRLNNDTLSHVFASHFIEHVDDLEGFLQEIVRVCRPGAQIEFIVPHFSNPYFYSDITHRSFFGLYTFSYLARDTIGFRRQVPGYARISGLELTDVKLAFGTLRSFFIRQLFKKSVQLLVNTSRYMQELYEESFTGLVQCYELRYTLSIAK
ncbi:class I SAM-dependent methyltransferase [Sphingomonas sp. ASY06-1R]|uniref:class I SAM-dependent methyltransferase n=1 Tax=Sphingomonas sp. ASY06-1R TaxID=3445771 RepID=UPI003FA1F8A9